MMMSQLTLVSFADYLRQKLSCVVSELEDVLGLNMKKVVRKRKVRLSANPLG